MQEQSYTDDQHQYDDKWQSYLMSPSPEVRRMALPSPFSFSPIDFSQHHDRTGSSASSSSSSAALPQVDPYSNRNQQVDNGSLSDDSSSLASSTSSVHPSGLVAPPDLLLQELHEDGTPKRPMNAYMIFARHRRPTMLQEKPGLKTGELSKELSAEWKAFSPLTKSFYLEQAKVLKDHFHKQHPNYVYKRRANNQGKRKSKTVDKTTHRGSGSSRGSSTDSSDSVMSSYSPLPSPRTLPGQESPSTAAFSLGHSLAKESPARQSFGSTEQQRSDLAPYSTPQQQRTYTAVSALPMPVSCQPTPYFGHSVPSPGISSYSTSLPYPSPSRSQFSSSFRSRFSPMQSDAYPGSQPDLYWRNSNGQESAAANQYIRSEMVQQPLGGQPQLEPPSVPRVSPDSYTRTTAQWDGSEQQQQQQQVSEAQQQSADSRFDAPSASYSSNLASVHSLPLPPPYTRDRNFQLPAFLHNSYPATSNSQEHNRLADTYSSRYSQQSTSEFPWQQSEFYQRTG